jgi:hypothetical protein
VTCFKPIPKGDLNARGWKLEPAGDERFERGIGAAGFRKCADARLQHALAGMILEAHDFVTVRFRRQPNREDHTVAARP